MEYSQIGKGTEERRKKENHSYTYQGIKKHISTHGAYVHDTYMIPRNIEKGIYMKYTEWMVDKIEEGSI